MSSVLKKADKLNLSLCISGDCWIPLTKGQQQGDSMFPLLLAWMICWKKNSAFASNLRCRDVHDIIVISIFAAPN